MITQLLTVTCVLVVTASSYAQQKDNKKALFVIVDGISAEQLKKVATPHLDAIVKVGGYTQAYVGGEKSTYSQTPTISAVGYNSLLTGTWVNKHNVWDNNIKAPNYHYWTIFRYFQEAYPAKKTAIFSTWLDNRTKLIGTGLPQTNHLRVHYSFDGLELDTLNFPHDKDAGHILKIDEKVVDEAASYISEQAPDLSWVYLEYTDDMGHKFGNSERFNKAIGYMDNQMGRLWKAIQYREKNFGEDWQIYITTDHGRSEPTGQNHGGQSDAERSTWIVTNAKGLNGYFKGNAGIAKVPGIVDIMPSLARHLDIPIKHEQAMEVDGVPLTGKLSVLWPNVVKENGKIKITWKSSEKEGNVKIWISTTNKFEEGGSDRYLLMGEVAVIAERASIDISKLPKGFYKIVLEGKYNMVNKWIVE